MTFSKRLLITLATLAFILIIGVFVIETNKVAKAQNQIKIYPVAYQIETAGNLSWQNPQNAFSQDLGDQASFSEFNSENSTFIGEKMKENSSPLITTTTTIPEETTTTTETTPTTSETPTTLEIPTTSETPTFLETTTTLEPTITTESTSFLRKIFSWFIRQVKAEDMKENSSPVTTSLTFSDFGIGNFNLENKAIQNVQLRASFAGKSQLGDKVLIEYFYNN